MKNSNSPSIYNLEKLDEEQQNNLKKQFPLNLSAIFQEKLNFSQIQKENRFLNSKLEIKEKKIGAYTISERKIKIQKYREKRNNNKLFKKFNGKREAALKKYRIQGQFVKKEIYLKSIEDENFANEFKLKINEDKIKNAKKIKLNKAKKSLSDKTPIELKTSIEKNKNYLNTLINNNNPNFQNFNNFQINFNKIQDYYEYNNHCAFTLPNSNIINKKESSNDDNHTLLKFKTKSKKEK